MTIRICNICSVTSDIIRFVEGKNRCIACYNNERREYGIKEWKNNKTYVKKTKADYRKKNRDRINRKERERYRKANGITPLFYRTKDGN